MLSASYRFDFIPSPSCLYSHQCETVSHFIFFYPVHSSLRAPLLAAADNLNLPWPFSLSLFPKSAFLWNVLVKFIIKTKRLSSRSQLEYHKATSAHRSATRNSGPIRHELELKTVDRHDWARDHSLELCSWRPAWLLVRLLSVSPVLIWTEWCMGRNAPYRNPLLISRILVMSGRSSENCFQGLCGWP